MHVDTEREAFERWVTNGFNRPDLAQKNGEGAYEVVSTYFYWQAWMARADLCGNEEK